VAAVPTDPGPFPDEHHEMENEIAEHFTAIYKLKSRQNTFSRICRLPPEILSQIFIFTTFSTGSEILSGQRTAMFLSWINITYVCRHFRAVALECPEMWTGIHFTSAAWATEMLKRSKGADLVLSFRQRILGDGVVYGQLIEQGSVEQLKEVLNQMHRVQDISLNAVTTAELEALFHGLEVEAPRLRSLSIKSTSSLPPYSRFSFEEPRYTLPIKFLCGGLPP